MGLLSSLMSHALRDSYACEDLMYGTEKAGLDVCHDDHDHSLVDDHAIAWLQHFPNVVFDLSDSFSFLSHLTIAPLIIAGKSVPSL